MLHVHTKEWKKYPKSTSQEIGLYIYTAYIFGRDPGHERDYYERLMYLKAVCRAFFLCA